MCACAVCAAVIEEERRPAPASSAPALTPFSFGPAAEHRVRVPRLPFAARCDMCVGLTLECLAKQKISEMSGVSVHQLPGQQQQQLARGGPRKVDLADVGSIIDPHTYYPTVLPFTSQPPVPKGTLKISNAWERQLDTHLADGPPPPLT